MAKIIGIDLGTSNSAAAVMEGTKPSIIPSAEGATVAGKAFPSVVAMAKDGQLLVGEPARRQAVTNPEGTVAAVKRKMGTNEKVKLRDKEYTPEQISAFILQKIKKDAESFLGEAVNKAVITVPAYFDDTQRQATKNAGEIAGLEVIRIINEPTAAAMAYGLDKGEGEQKVLVFDLGGGTLDVTVMEISTDDEGQATFEVKSTSGDTKLGGHDMDNALVDYIVSEFKKESGFDVSKDAMAMNRIREAAEKAKIELSTVLETEINLPFITADESGPKHLQLKITRAKLEELVKPIIERMREPVEQALSDSKLSVNSVDKILLVGGPTRMPIVQRFLEDFVGKKIEHGVDPMEAVAKGAAIQAAILGGEFKDRSVLLLDVTPLTLGVETLGGVMTPQIERNTTIPTSKTMTFSTAADNQTSVEVHVLQGERPMAADNKSLGRFILEGLPPAPRGVPKVDVTFDIDANGILTVTAKDQASGKSQNITIKGSTNLSEEEIERMKKEAEAHASEDRARKELIEARNQSDHLISVTEKTLKDAGDKIGDEIKKSIEAKMDDLRKVAKESNDAEEVKRSMQALSDEVSKVGETLYKEAEAAQSTDKSEQTPGEKQENETVEGEYKEVKEEEKQD